MFRYYWHVGLYLGKVYISLAFLSGMTEFEIIFDDMFAVDVGVNPTIFVMLGQAFVVVGFQVC